MGLATRSCEELAVIWTTKQEFLFWTPTEVGQKKLTEFGWRLFFFGDHLILAGKTAKIPVKAFFFWDYLSVNEEKKTTQTDQRSIKIWIKIVWCYFQYPKQTPPKANSWLRTCTLVCRQFKPGK